MWSSVTLPLATALGALGEDAPRPPAVLFVGAVNPNLPFPGLCTNVHALPLVDLAAARASSWVVLGMSIFFTLIFGAWIWSSASSSARTTDSATGSRNCAHFGPSVASAENWRLGSVSPRLGKRV